MKESGHAAFRADPVPRPRIFGIDEDVFANRDIHVHFPAGAIPKDGPSAGITMASAMISTLTGIPMRKDVAMTGEITLTGKVLPIGGLKEKALAAMRHGIKIVVIPDKNKKDLEDIPQEYRDALTFIPVKTIDDVLNVVLTDKIVSPKHRAAAGATAGTPHAAPKVLPEEKHPQRQTQEDCRGGRLKRYSVSGSGATFTFCNAPGHGVTGGFAFFQPF